MHSNTTRDALTGAPIFDQPRMRLPVVDDDKPMPLKLHQGVAEGVGLKYSPAMARYLKLAAPPLDVRAREKRQTAIHCWYAQPLLVASLSKDSSLGSKKIKAAHVVARLVDYNMGRISYKEAARLLDCTVAWLHQRERKIKRLTAAVYDAMLQPRLDD